MEGKNLGEIDDDEIEEVDDHEAPGDNSHRARNRTVMLTPEITGQVRARLAQEVGGSGEERDRHDFRRFADQSGSPSLGLGAAHQGATLHGLNPVSAGQVTQRAGGTFQRPLVELGTSTAGGGDFERVADSRRDRGLFQPGSLQSGATSQSLSASTAVTGVALSPNLESQQRGGSQGRSRSSADQVSWVKESKVVGFLLSYDRNPSGEFYVLRKGRLIVSSQAPGPGNYLILQDESVSPMHAIIRVGEDGQLQVLDQLSECGTKVRRIGSAKVEELSGEKTTVGHGDKVSFGERSFIVCLVPGDPEGPEGSDE